MSEPCIPVRMNHLCCPICSKILRNPVTISCGHNFCLQCIQRRLDHYERSKSSCSCPECGDVFASRPQLIRNTNLAKLVQDMEGSDALSRKQEHSVASTQALKRAQKYAETGSPLCKKHSTSLDVYCCTDQQIVCAICVSTNHMGHTIGFVREERRRKQVQLQNVQAKSKQILQKQEKKRKDLEKTLEQIQEEKRKTEDYCESVLAGVIDSLQRHYLSVRELIRAQEKAAAAQVQISLQALHGKMEAVRKRSAELESLAKTDSDVHFLEKWASLRCLCEEEHLRALHIVSEDPFLPFELTKRGVKEFGRQLEELCDKEFPSILQTGRPEVNSALTEDTVEPKTRAEFLQYACSLTLDRTTAHEDLAVSEGDKEVRLRHHERKNKGLCSTERFIHRRQLLCREGLRAKRCYYEIEVEGDKAEIALAYKSIDRKSRSPLSAFGGNANSWSLDRSTNYSVSHSGRSIQLTASPSHRRIGVYVEFEKGTLSFYEVSDMMRFLYKVEATFTQPLYPGFWLGEKCCIRICDLSRERL